MTLAPTDLAGLVARLEGEGDLRRVKVEVDPYLEIAAITDRVSKRLMGGPALFFERVKGKSFPVTTNLFGSLHRIALALGVGDLKTSAERVASGVFEKGGTAADRLEALLNKGRWEPVRTDQAPCREVVFQKPDLNDLPALWSWPGDGGLYLTLPQVFTRDRETGKINCGVYRIQIFDDRTAGIRWRPGSGGASHHQSWKRRGERMPAAVVLGGAPALLLAAAAPLPPGIEETAFAGFLQGSPLKVAECLTCDLEVPAAGEFVIEGYVDAVEELQEGPFGNHTGFYDPGVKTPVFHVTAVTRRRDAIFPATVVGPPPTENCWLAKATERIFLPLIQVDFPEIREMNLPIEGIFHGCALLSVTEGDGRDLLERLWNSHYFRSSRLLVLFDGEVNVQNSAECYWKAVNQVDPERDLMVGAGRLGIDARGHGVGRSVKITEKMARRVTSRWMEYGLD